MFSGKRCKHSRPVEGSRMRKTYELQVKCKNCGSIHYHLIPFGTDVQEGILGSLFYDSPTSDLVCAPTICLKCKNCGSGKLGKIFLEATVEGVL